VATEYAEFGRIADISRCAVFETELVSIAGVSKDEL